jgi:hypothetical protein
MRDYTTFDLCELYDDVYFDIDSFYPDNFENTQTF